MANRQSVCQKSALFVDVFCDLESTVEPLTRNMSSISCWSGYE